MTNKKRDKPAKPRKVDEVVLLEDLAPRGDVSGGGAKFRFGEPLKPRIRKGRGPREG